LYLSSNFDGFFFFQFIELSASLFVDEFPLSIKAFLIKSIETCAKLQNFNFYLFIQFLTLNIVKRDKCPKEWSSKSQFPSYYLFQHIVMFSNLLCECVKQNNVSTLACRHAAVASCCTRSSPLYLFILGNFPTANEVYGIKTGIFLNDVTFHIFSIQNI